MVNDDNNNMIIIEEEEEEGEGGQEQPSGPGSEYTLELAPPRPFLVPSFAHNEPPVEILPSTKPDQKIRWEDNVYIREIENRQQLQIYEDDEDDDSYEIEIVEDDGDADFYLEIVDGEIFYVFETEGDEEDEDDDDSSDSDDESSSEEQSDAKPHMPLQLPIEMMMPSLDADTGAAKEITPVQMKEGGRESSAPDTVASTSQDGSVVSSNGKKLVRKTEAEVEADDLLSLSNISSQFGNASSANLDVGNFLEDSDEESDVKDLTGMEVPIAFEIEPDVAKENDLPTELQGLMEETPALNNDQKSPAKVEKTEMSADGAVATTQASEPTPEPQDEQAPRLTSQVTAQTTENPPKVPLYPPGEALPSRTTAETQDTLPFSPVQTDLSPKRSETKAAVQVTATEPSSPPAVTSPVPNFTTDLAPCTPPRSPSKSMISGVSGSCKSPSGSILKSNIASPRIKEDPKKKKKKKGITKTYVRADTFDGEHRVYSWEKPNWTNKQLKSTEKGNELRNGVTNLAGPITFPKRRTQNGVNGEEEQEEEKVSNEELIRRIQDGEEAIPLCSLPGYRGKQRSLRFSIKGAKIREGVTLEKPITKATIIRKPENWNRLADPAKLRSTAKGEELKMRGSLEAPITQATANNDGENHLANKNVLKRKGVVTTEKKAYQWEKPSWATQKLQAAPVLSPPKKTVEWTKPEWTKAKLGGSNRGLSIKNGEDLEAPISKDSYRSRIRSMPLRSESDSLVTMARPRSNLQRSATMKPVPRQREEHNDDKDKEQEAAYSDDESTVMES